MRDGSKHIDELFEVARKKPTELRLEDVDKMVAGFPLTPAPFDWSSIINLNSIIMTSVSAFIIAGSLMLYTGSAQNPETNPENQNQEPIAQGISSIELADNEASESESLELEVETSVETEPANNEPPVEEPEPIQAPEIETPIVEEVEPETEVIETTTLITESETEFQVEDPTARMESPDKPVADPEDMEDPETLASVGATMGDGRMDFNVSDFHSLSVAGSMEVDVRQSNSFKVWAEGKDEALEKLDIEVNNGKLKIGLKNKKNGNKNCNSYSSCESLQIYIEMPSFDNIDVAGSAEMTIHSFTGLGGVDFSIAGSGSIDVDGELEMSGNVDCSIAGSGEMNLDGTAQRADISIAGSGDFSGLDLRVREADISIAGSGEVGIHAEESLDISITGSGDVEYVGNPRIDKSIMGSGDIRQH